MVCGSNPGSGVGREKKKKKTFSVKASDIFRHYPEICFASSASRRFWKSVSSVITRSAGSKPDQITGKEMNETS